MRKIYLQAALVAVLAAFGAIAAASALLTAGEAVAGDNIFESGPARHYKLLYVEADTRLEEMTDILDRNYERFYEIISKIGFELKAPPKPLEWIIFESQKDFQEYAMQADRMDSATLDAYYSTRSNRVAMVCRPDEITPGDHERITHEAAHQLSFNTGFQKRGVMYPFWVSEGIATNLENDPSGRCGLDGTSSGRRARFAESAGEFLPFLDFIVMIKLPPGDHASCLKIYSQAWGMFNFLMTRYPAELKAYLESMSRQRPGRSNVINLQREFVKAFGPIDEIEADWERFVQKTIRAERRLQRKTYREDSASERF